MSVVRRLIASSVLKAVSQTTAGGPSFCFVLFCFCTTARQLDKSYLEGKPPHHIPESLSELTHAVYLARRLPVQVSIAGRQNACVSCCIVGDDSRG